MGTCYSTHTTGAPANTHHLPYVHPADMKKNGGSQHSFGFRKPYSAARHSAACNRNSAEHLQVNEHSSHTGHLPQQGGRNVGFASRFGFHMHSDSNSNVASSNASTDSLNTTHSKKKCQVQSQVGTKRSLSFEPDDHDGPFLMIDDDSSSQTNDMSESKIREYHIDSTEKRTQSSDSLIMRRKLICEDLKNANIIPSRSPSHNPSRSHVRSMHDTVGVTHDACTQAKKGGKGLQHGCPQSGLGGKKGTSKTRKFTDKIKQPFQRFSNGGTKKEKGPKSENSEMTGKETCMSKKGSVISKIRTSSRSSVHTKSSSDSGTSTVRQQSVSHSTENGDDSVFVADSKTTSGYYELEIGVRAAAPIAMIDSVETTSFGSLNSEDLMLETDICLDDYTEGYGHGDPLTGRIISRRSSQRNRSLSGERHDPKSTSVTEEKATKMGTEGAIPKRPTSLKIEDHTPADPQMEPLQELATLLRENEVVKRCPTSSQERASRPSSFPGSEDSEKRVAATARSRHHSSMLKPPRQAATMEDEEAKVVMDGFTYRHLMQDLTMFKTMLLKLRRVVQEEEIGSPFGSQPWKIPNGYRLGSTGGSSQADSPHAQDSDPFMSTAPLDTLKQENVELMQQLGILQQQLQEKDNTIKLLQHQMTKYECGHLGPQSKVFTNATTQTDKPRSLPISKSVFESVPSMPQSTSAGSTTCMTSVSGQMTKTYPRHQTEHSGRLARKTDDNADRKTQCKQPMSGQHSGVKPGKVTLAGDAREGNVTHSSTSSTEHTAPSSGCVSFASTRHTSKQATRGQPKTFESGITRKVVECESVADKARPTSQLRRPTTRLPKSTDIGGNNSNSSAPAAVRKIPRGTSQLKSFAGIART